MWHVIEATIYDPTQGRVKATRFTLESNQLDLLVLQLAEALTQAMDGQPLLPPGPLKGCLIVGLTISSTSSFNRAAPRDTEVEHTLQMMKSSVVDYLSSSGGSPPGGSGTTSSDSSPN